MRYEIVARLTNKMDFQSLAHVYGGHSSHVTAVEFMQDDARIISLGGNDTSVMQWIVS